MDSFRESVLASGGDPQQFGGLLGSWGGRLGSAPDPFDGVDGRRLAGPQGSHPLAAVTIDELVRRSTDGLDGQIAINEPVRIGEGINGRISVTARRDIRARGAILRLCGVRLAEQRRSEEDRDSQGRVTRSESWVAVD